MAALFPAPAPAPIPTPAVSPDVPELKPVPDFDESVAGEEDPGAALDLSSGGATMTQHRSLASGKNPGPRRLSR